MHTSMNDWTVGPRRINAKAKEIGQIVMRSYIHEVYDAGLTRLLNGGSELDEP
jgi:hypothetical protein